MYTNGLLQHYVLRTVPRTASKHRVLRAVLHSLPPNRRGREFRRYRNALAEACLKLHAERQEMAGAA